uniref:PBPe domain-containing protein n=1 Tax=Macrostomum lignano TaxID=282301 RepID=A0A1I8F3F7_9PLAT
APLTLTTVMSAMAPAIGHEHAFEPLWLTACHCHCSSFLRCLSCASVCSLLFGSSGFCTILGRLFAMMWISFGLVLISMFTAVVTAALSQSAQDPKKIIDFFRLIWHRTPTWTATALATYRRQILTAGALGIGDTSDEAPHHGALVEHFMYLHIRQEHPGRMRSLKPQLVLKRPSIRGVNSNLPPRVGECLAENFLRHQIGIYRQLLSHRHIEDQENDREVAVEVAQSLFSTSNKHLGIVAAIFGVLHSRRLSKTSRQQKRNQDLTEPDPAQNKDLTANTDRVAEILGELINIDNFIWAPTLHIHLLVLKIGASPRALGAVSGGGDSGGGTHAGQDEMATGKESFGRDLARAGASLHLSLGVELFQGVLRRLQMLLLRSQADHPGMTEGLSGREAFRGSI